MLPLEPLIRAVHRESIARNHSRDEATDGNANDDR